jgi:hypothetical protein
MNNNNSSSVSITGRDPFAVARARAILNNSQNVPLGTGQNLPASTGSSNGPVPTGNNSQNAVATTSQGGAIAGVTMCATTGAYFNQCPSGVFCYLTQQAPLFVSKNPTRNDFDVPSFVARDFLTEIYQRCRSVSSISGTTTIGANDSSGCSQIITDSTSSTTKTITIEGQEGCEQETPGLMLSVGFSQNVSPTPVSFKFTIVGQDGCPDVMDNVQIQMTALGTGQLVVLFSCVENQRLYPTLARLRNKVVQIKSGTTIPGVGPALTSDLLYPDEVITIEVTGPTGMTLTVDTLAPDHPALSCIYTNVQNACGGNGCSCST